MTAPVITESSQQLAMTAPVLQTQESMSFVLPADVSSLDEAPVPTDSRVTLRAVPAKTVAVLPFSGWYTEELGSAQFEALVGKMRENKDMELAQPSSRIKWAVAQYHPPFTLPFLRRNEIWVEISHPGTTSPAENHPATEAS